MKNKRHITRTLTVLIICLLCGVVSAHAEKKPWVKIENNVMTFLYGEKETLATDEYWLNEGENNPAWKDKAREIQKAVFDQSFKDARPTTCYSWFSDFIDITSIEGMENLNTSQVTSMYDMFGGCRMLENIDLSHFDTRNVTDMEFMFSQCYSFASLDLSSFNTASVTSTSMMFFAMHNVQHIFVSDKFTTDKVTDDASMFMNCSLLSGAITFDNSGKYGKEYANTATGYFTDVKQKADAKYYWVKFDNGTLTYYYGKKTALGDKESYLKCIIEGSPSNPSFADDVTTAVIDESFRDARPVFCDQWFSYPSLTQIKGMENLNTSEMTNMARMFDGCSSLLSLDLSHFDTSKVRQMSYMFCSCCALQQLDLSSFNTSNVEYMNSMFDNCMSLPYLDISHFDTQKVTSMYRMFFWCPTMKYIFAGDGFKTDNVTDSDNMFWGCLSLRGGIEYQEDKTSPEYANQANGYFTNVSFREQAEYPWTKIDGTTMTFYYGKKDKLKLEDGEMYVTAEYRVAPDEVFNVKKAVFDNSFKEARPVSCLGWFFYCQNLIDIEGWENVNTEKAIGADYMFYECRKLQNLDLSMLNMSNLTSMRYTFTNCTNLKSIYFGEKLDMSKVTESTDMFKRCNATIYCPANSYATFSTSNILADRNLMAYTDINPAPEYGTICVPQGSDLAADTYEGFDKLYTVSNIDATGGYVQLKEEKQLEAGKAYIYHRNLPADCFKSVIAYKPNDATASEPLTDGLLRGTFIETAAPTGSYFLKEDSHPNFVAAGGTTVVRANEAYLLPEAGTTLPSTLSLKLETDGIEEITTDGAAKSNTIYDLMGRKVNILVKGRVYIMNGKKIQSAH